MSGQSSNSGKASAGDNTTVGNVGSGKAANTNTTGTSVVLTNSNSGVSGAGAGAGLGDSSATLDATTGPHSTNTVSTKNTWSNTVDNDNNVFVVNFSDQNAKSGKVSAHDNTTVGDVMSGDAANNNTTSSSVVVNN